jgi:hypothetical protein
MKPLRQLLFKKFTIITDLSIQEVCQKIEENLEPQRDFKSSLFYSYSKKYVGELWNNRFTIRKYKPFRDRLDTNIITGDIFYLKNKTNININLDSHFNYLFISYGILFIIFVLFMFASKVFNYFKNDNLFLDRTLFCLLFFFIFLTTTILTMIEANCIRKEFTKLFNK